MIIGDKIIHESEDGFDIAIIDNICEQEIYYTFITGIAKGKKAKQPISNLQMHTKELEAELRIKHKDYIEFINEYGSPFHSGGWEPENVDEWKI